MYIIIVYSLMYIVHISTICTCIQKFMEQLSHFGFGKESSRRKSVRSSYPKSAVYLFAPCPECRVHRGNFALKFKLESNLYQC